VNGVDLDRLIGSKQRELLDSRVLTIDPIRRRHFRRAMETTRRLLNSSFDRNPLFVPMSREEFRFQSDQMLWVLDPRISYLARMDGEPVGVITCLPDLNPILRATRSRLKVSTPLHYVRFRRRRTRASLIFGGVSPAQQNRGLAAILLLKALQGMRVAGYDELGITWISDSNAASLRQMEKLGAERLHRLYLFQKGL
jgi:GNAT superfamily N-acetyltransferase